MPVLTPCSPLCPAHGRGSGDGGCGTPWRGLFQPGGHQAGPGRGRGHSHPVCRLGLPPGLQQTELNRPSYQLSPLCPTRLSPVLGKRPPALCQGQHWSRVGNWDCGGCFPRDQPGVGVSGERVEPGLGPRGCSAVDLPFLKMNFWCYFNIIQVIPKRILLIK